MFKSHTKRGFLLCMGATLIVLALALFGWLDVLELKALDFRFQTRGERPVNTDIVMIDIDEKSIEELGRWPWPRSMHADLIHLVSGAGASVISYDVLFTEPDRYDPESDAIFAEAAGDVGNTIMGIFFKDGFGDIFGQNLAPTYPELYEASMSGFVNFEPDDKDGVTRRASLFAVEHEEIEEGANVVYPSLALMTYMVLKDITLEEALQEFPVVASLNPELAQNKLTINYRPGYSVESLYPRYSFTEVLNQRLDLEEAFKDKVVFVGATATTLYDIKIIPFMSKFPGVYTHMNVLDNLLARDWLKEVTVELTPLYIILVGLLLGYILPRLSPWGQLAFFAVVVITIVTLGFWLFFQLNLVIHMVPPLITALACYGGILFYRMIIEEREKRKIKGSFKQYLSPKIIEVITKDPSKLKLGGEEREVTIFFLDIAGFTTMSEALKPAQLVEVMNICLTRFSNIIMKHDGLINKYIGDCIMAFWNSPIDQPRHATLACMAALECIEAIPKLNAEFEKKGLPPIDCRVGINTGTVVVGNMGSAERFDYTVMGDAVNLASRLEGANKQYKTHIMVSQETFEQAKEDIEARDIDLIRVKGKKEPKKVFELLCKRKELSEQITNARMKYHSALGLYRRKDFDGALTGFKEVLDYLPNDHLSHVYLERLKAFKDNPPPEDWDGVFEMKTK